MTTQTFRTDARAPYGVYLSTRPLDVRFVGADGETLEGRPGVGYRRLPTALVVAAGPLFGALFVVAFPVLVAIGLLAALRARVADHPAWLAAPRFQPGAVRLQRDTGDADEALELAALRREVDTRRGAEAHAA